MSHDSRITIQRPGTSQDEAGEPVESWVPVATVWATIRHVNGLATIRSGADVSVVKASIRINWRTDVDDSMRVVHGATVYDIEAVLPDVAGRKHVDLVCQTGAKR